MNKAITLRPMTPQDIPFGLKLSQAAGWNQVAADWVMLLEQSASGSYLACYNGVEAGTVTTVTYQKRFHWIGMMLVAAEYRRLGIGTILLEAAIDSVKAHGIVCLDATPAGKQLYDTLGFQDIYCLGRWLRLAAPLDVPTPNDCHPLSSEILPYRNLL